MQWTRALYRGVAGPLVTVGLVQGLNFAIYDATRRGLQAAAEEQANKKNASSFSVNDDCLLQQQQQQHDKQRHISSSNNPLWHVAVASVTAGTVVAFVTSPLVMMKTKQQVQQISLADAARQTIQQHRGLWMPRGFGPHFVSETAGRGIYFVAYEVCKRAWMMTMQQQQQPFPNQHGTIKTTRADNTTGISMAGRMASAGVAGMVSWTLIFPLDVLRNRLFASSSSCVQQQQESAWRLAQRIYHGQGGGLRAFFRGYGISLVRAGPVAALVLPIYDYTLERL